MKKSFKRTLSFLLLVCLIGSCMPIYADSAVPISTPEDLMKMKNNPSGSYVLQNNIDLKGISWEPFAFSGSLDGNGYSIINITIDKTPTDKKTVTDANVYAKGTSYEAVCCGFFTVLENAVIKNLGLWGIEINCGGKDFNESIFAGLVSGYAYNSKVENCQVAGTCSVETSGPCFGAGGVFGFVGAGTVNKCHIECELICNDTDIEYKDEQFMGGVYCFGYSDVTDCYVSIQGWDSDHGYVHDGGMIGCFMYYDGYEVDYNPATISGNYVCGQITFFEDNTDTRAYCEPFIGELMNWDVTIEDNRHEFDRNQVFTYDEVLTPHCTCEEKKIVSFDVEAHSGQPGYHLDVCDSCGYLHKSDFTFPLEGLFTDTKIQNWQPSLEGCTDLLIISSHADDEQLFYAGILPYYSKVRDLAVQMVYGTEHLYEPYRFYERQDGLWAVGITNTLESSGWNDDYSETREEAMAILNAYYGLTEDDVVNWVRDIILKYKPQVVITHDIDGEYGHGYHMLMSWALKTCLEKYSSDFPFLKKAYLHLWDENPITLSVIDERCGEFNGLTPFQVTQKYGFAEHTSQHQWWFYDWILYGNRYDEIPSEFVITKASQIQSYSPLSWGMIYGDTSLDKNKNDLFEGLVSYKEQERIEKERIAEEERLEQERIAAEKKAEEERLARVAKTKKTAIIIGSILAILILGLLIIRTYNKTIRKRRKRKR